MRRIVQFENGSANVLMEKGEKSCEVELSSMLVKAQTMEYLKNLHEQLFQVTSENVKK